MESQIFNVPRLMIAAPKSGSGKTTLTCALLQLLKNHGKNPVAFKCGPDFIDPMFHKQVLGLHSTNLDSFFCDEGLLKEIFVKNIQECPGADCAIIEGVMGLFDGLGGSSLTASSYEIAKITQTPILLVIDASGMSRSIVPLVKGFLDYDREHSGGKCLIKGIFLNKVSKSSFMLLKQMIEDENGIPAIGYALKDSDIVLKSRHLGLILPSEVENLKESVQKSARLLEDSINFDKLEQIMTAEPLAFETREAQTVEKTLSIAVAMDEAFCFYYHENLRLLEENGVKLQFFSPLYDKAVPEDADGILLGGGYPELYASQLEDNESMRSSLKSAVKNGIPIIAECGGFMYLQEKLIAQGGKEYKMCGAIKGECRYTGKLVRFGYAEFTHGPYSLKGHEFHYFDSTANGSDFVAEKPLSHKKWDCMIFKNNILVGFPHLYYPSSPEIVSWFIDSCKKRKNRVE